MTKQMPLAGNPESTSDPSRPDRERGLPDHELFVPKDEHCGIWHNPPNPDCASSFGDNGTTASVSCYGALIHLSQYLAVGPSGSFTFDYDDPDELDEPYFVCSRSDTLDERSQCWGQEQICIHVDNSQPGLPPSPSVGSVLEIQEIPRVKWVNWRWPRYEYRLPDSNFTATCQWLVYKNIVLQQLTFRKPQDEPRQCFAIVPISYDLSVSLIRDTDYLDASNDFNGVSRLSSDYSNTYKLMHGPNRCGKVLVHKLSDGIPNPDQKPRDQTDQGARQDGTPRNSDEKTHISQAAGSPPDEDRVSRSGKSEGHDNALASVPLHPGQPVEANQDPSPGFEDTGHKTTVEEKEGSPRKSTITTQHKYPRSIAAVTTIFVNGEVLPELPPLRKLELPKQGVLEVVYAYKLVHLPGHEVDWRNLIVSARDADVNRILKKETHRLWGSSSGPSNSLPSLGLSLRDPSKDKTAAENWGEHAQQANDSESRKAPQDESKPEDTSETAAAPPPETSGLEPDADVPEGTPNNSSARNHIEYLTWRHLEHILSVCAIPLSPPSLFESGTSKVQNEAIALTCGDLSGHRVCTSASL